MTKTTWPEWPEQDTVKAHDWRLHAVTAVSKDSPGFRRGDVLKMRFPLELRDGSTVQAGAPNIEALLLDYSARLDDEAQVAWTALDRDQNAFAEDAALFEVLQQRMASAVFAFNGIESFANEVSSYAYYRGFQYEQTQASGLVAVLDLKAVQWLHIEEKLSSVLPAYLKISSPKGTVLWQNFKRLKKIRSRIVHVKGVDRGNSDDRWLWEELLDPKGWDFGNQSRDLIGHYVPHIEGLNFRWFYKWPWAGAPTGGRDENYAPG